MTFHKFIKNKQILITIIQYTVEVLNNNNNREKAEKLMRNFTPVAFTKSENSRGGGEISESHITVFR